MAEYYGILTEAGETKQMECLAGTTAFDIWEAAVGDGNGSFYEPEKTQTALKNQCWRGLVDSVENVGNQRRVVFHLPDDSYGYTIREVGLFDQSGNLLIAYKVPETQRISSGTGVVKKNSFKLFLTMLNDAVLPFVIDPNINTASVDYVDEHFQKLEEKGEANGYAPLDSAGFVPAEHLQGSFVPFCVNSGAITDGTESLLSEANNTITAQAPFTITSASGITKKITENLSLDVSTCEPGQYEVMFDFDTSSLFLFSGTIHTGKKFPENAQTGDILFDISCAPYSTRKLLDDGTVKIECARIGLYDCVSGGANSLSTYAYNENLHDLSTRLKTDHSNDTKPYIVEQYQNPNVGIGAGNAGYRKWSNGMMEQWASTATAVVANSSMQVSFLTPYVSNVCVFTQQTGAGIDSGSGTWSVHSMNNNGFTVQNYTDFSCILFWYAIGRWRV